METYQSRQKNKLIAIVITLVIVVGLIIVIDKLNSNTNSTTSATTTSTMPSTVAPATTNDSTTDTSSTSSTTSAYKDGTYSADAEYYVPHGYEDIKVTLTVQNGAVTDSEIVNSEGDHESVRYQEEFTSVYKSLVVGKSLDELKLSRVSGASDTTDGFNDALAKIKQQAQA